LGTAYDLTELSNRGLVCADHASFVLPRSERPSITPQANGRNAERTATMADGRIQVVADLLYRIAGVLPVGIARCSAFGREP
jgi:hypothetical protein